MTRQTVMDALRSMNRPVTSAALATLLCRSPTTVSGILSKAAAYGLVTKTPMPGFAPKVYWAIKQPVQP